MSDPRFNSDVIYLIDKLVLLVSTSVLLCDDHYREHRCLVAFFKFMGEISLFFTAAPNNFYGRKNRINPLKIDIIHKNTGEIGNP